MRNACITILRSIFLPSLIILYIGVCTGYSHFPEYDEAYNATVAKNLSAGDGYSTSYDTRVQFNPEITTGPSLIFPAAILISFFGAKYWIPVFTTLLLSYLLIITILLFTYRHFEENPKIAHSSWKFQLLFSTIILCFWMPEIKSIRFLGEFPAALLVILGTIIIFLPKAKVNTVFWGGIVLGIGILTKMIVVGLIIPIILAWSFFWIYDNNSHNKKPTLFINQLLALIAGMIIPILLFEFYKFFSLGFDQYIILKNIESEFFKGHGSGISQMIASKNDWTLVLENLENNFIALIDEKDSCYKLIVFTISSLAIFSDFISRLTTKKKIFALERICLALNISVFVLLFYWFLFNPLYWYRTVSPAIDIASFSIGISMVVLFKERAIKPNLLIIAIWILFLPMNWDNAFSIPEKPTEMILSTNNTSNYLEKLQTKNNELLGCGWWANRRLEYFMPNSLNFKDCLNSDFTKSVLIVDSAYWNYGQKMEIITVEQRCSKLIFESYPYKVYQCKQ